MSDAQAITKLVKTVLAEKYGYKNVSVKRGRGTAWGWVEATIEVPEPEPHSHSLRSMETERAREAVYTAMRAAGLKFYTYTADDGYGSERDEFMLQLRYTGGQE